MPLHALAGLALLWSLADLADALSMREASPTFLGGDPEVVRPKLEEHVRPERRNAYSKVTDGQAGEAEEHLEAYRKAGQLLGRAHGMSHSRHILQFVMSHPKAPALPPSGCLYLPNDRAWTSFYQHVEHPFPPLFTEMIANSYYPTCNETSLTGVRLPPACGATGGLRGGSGGCLRAARLGRAGAIDIYETEGHVGLPDKWVFHIENAKKAPHPRRSAATAGNNATRAGAPPVESGGCDTSSELPGVPPGSRLEIPTAYVVCRTSDDDDRITKEMVHEQNRWANEAYGGLSPWGRTDFDGGHPDAVNMQITFKLVDVKIVTDPSCATKGFTETFLAHKYNPKPLEQFTIVIITDDMSGVLGQTEFPFEVPEDSPQQVVLVSAQGFRSFASRNSGDMLYDEGDTVVHEAGHGLGLYHTFQSGCRGRGGDWVDDTNPEGHPHYVCIRDASCKAPDPVHNFMDYTPDACMMGFTEGQKRRAWCVLEKSRPTLYKKSLTVDLAGTIGGAPRSGKGKIPMAHGDRAHAFA